jgi:CheY-like chemotaxis protein
MRQASLSGRSILVVEGEPFIACCLQMVLQAAGAHVRRVDDSCEGLKVSDRADLSAAVLDFKDGLRDCDLGIARRLAERRLPFVLYGGEGDGRCDAWPSAPLVSKWTSGAEIVETLCALILPPQSRPSPAVAAALAAPEVGRSQSTRTMAHIESLMMKRGSAKS